MSELPMFMTIREAAKAGVMREYQLRCLLAQERLPGIYTGTKRRTFLVNLGALAEQLERESRAAAGMGE